MTTQLNAPIETDVMTTTRQYYTLRTAAQLLRVGIPSVVAMSESGCLPRIVVRNGQSVILAAGVDALIALDNAMFSTRVA